MLRSGDWLEEKGLESLASFASKTEEQIALRTADLIHVLHLGTTHLEDKAPSLEEFRSDMKLEDGIMSLITNFQKAVALALRGPRGLADFEKKLAEADKEAAREEREAKKAAAKKRNVAG